MTSIHRIFAGLLFTVALPMAASSQQYQPTPEEIAKIKEYDRKLAPLYEEHDRQLKACDDPDDRYCAQRAGNRLDRAIDKISSPFLTPPYCSAPPHHGSAAPTDDLPNCDPVMIEVEYAHESKHFSTAGSGIPHLEGAETYTFAYKVEGRLGYTDDFSKVDLFSAYLPAEKDIQFKGGKYQEWDSSGKPGFNYTMNLQEVDFSAITRPAGRVSLASGPELPPQAAQVLGGMPPEMLKMMAQTPEGKMLLDQLGAGTAKGGTGKAVLNINGLNAINSRQLGPAELAAAAAAGQFVWPAFIALPIPAMTIDPMELRPLSSDGHWSFARSFHRERNDGEGSFDDIHISIKVAPLARTKPPCDVVIWSYEDGHKLAFSNAGSGELTINLQAKATPAKYGKNITWTLPQLDASTKVEVTPKNRQGDKVTVKLRGLPKDNAGLGVKAFTATIDEKTCQASDDLALRIFFPRNAKNNPGGKEPNWFYYWKQTPAARPKGQAINLEYGGGTDHMCGPNKDGIFINTALYIKKYGYKTLRMCDLSKLSPPFDVNYPLLDRFAPKIYPGTRKVQNIDVFAVAILHEYEHFLHDHNWGLFTLTASQDKDQDGLPDYMEAGLAFDPTKFQTYLANHWNLKNIGGDEEWLAYEAMRHHKVGAFDKYDWAFPGNQWRK